MGRASILGRAPVLGGTNCGRSSMNPSILFRSGNWCRAGTVCLRERKNICQEISWLNGFLCMRATLHHITTQFEHLFSMGSCKNQVTLLIDFLCCIGVVLCSVVLCCVVLCCVVLCCVVLYPGHGPEDIRRYLGHMTRDTTAVISWVICPGYLLISLGHAANHQTCRLITANNKITQGCDQSMKTPF